MLQTLADVRAEYVRLLPYLRSDQPETVIGDFWYTYKRCAADCQCRGQLQWVTFGYICSDVQTKLYHFIFGGPTDFMRVEVSRLVDVDDKIVHTSIIAISTHYCIPVDINLQDVLAESPLEEFVAAIRAEYII